MNDRFLLIVPLCAAVVALSSLAWHSAPDVGARSANRLRHLRALELGAAAEGAWEAAVTERDEEWPGAGWPGVCRSPSPSLSLCGSSTSISTHTQNGVLRVCLRVLL
jgi:hypothetical protein